MRARGAFISVLVGVLVTAAAAAAAQPYDVVPIPDRLRGC
jgi:hypothetical protein